MGGLQSAHSGSSPLLPPSHFLFRLRALHGLWRGHPLCHGLSAGCRGHSLVPGAPSYLFCILFFLTVFVLSQTFSQRRHCLCGALRNHPEPSGISCGAQGTPASPHRACACRPCCRHLRGDTQCLITKRFCTWEHAE